MSLRTDPAGAVSQDFFVRTVADNTAGSDESAAIDVYNVTGTTLANGEERLTVQGVILDDDGTGQKRAAFVSDVILIEGDTGSKEAMFEVRLSQPSTQSVTLNYETRDGSAVAGSDYAAALGSVTFAAGETVKTVSVDVFGDIVVEDGEQFSLVVSPTPADAGLLAVDFAAGIATIVGDDASGTVPTLTISGGEILEGSSNADNLLIYTAMLSEPALTPVSFVFRPRSGTTDEDSDFDSGTTTITIPAGSTTWKFSVRTVADNTAEADESVLVDFFNVVGAALANGEDRTTVQGTIKDDDGSGLKRVVIVNDATIVEGDAGTKQVVFEVRLSRASDEAITVNYETRDGTANAGADYTATSGAITFAAGQTVAAVSVDVIGDTSIENGEQFSLVVTSTTADEDKLAIDSDGGVATIIGDDASGIVPSLTITGGEILEGSSNADNFIIYTAMLSQPALTPVSFAFRPRSGTTDEDADFDTGTTVITIPAGSTTTQFSVRTVAENTSEADESVLIDVFNLSGAAFANGEDRVTVQGLILDDDGTGLKRVVTISDVSIREGDNGTKEAVFEIRLSQPSDETITLGYETRDGTAIAGSDYTAASGEITFARGQTVQSVVVDVAGDTAIEGTQQFSLVVAPIVADADQLAVDFAGGIATIIDDDASGTTPSLTIIGGEILEGSSNADNNLIFTAMLSEPALSSVSFSFRPRSGTSDEDTDFDSGTVTVTIPSGQTTTQFVVRTVADNTAEADESVLVDVFNVVGAALSNGEDRTTVQGNILDDDGTGLKRAVTVSDTTIVEGDGGTKQAVFEVRLSRPAEDAIDFSYTTVQGTATSSVDFNGASSADSGVLSFAPGQTVASVAIGVPGNTTPEDTEQFQLVLTTTSNLIEGGRTGVSGTATLLDDDSGFGFLPEISLIGGEIVEGSSNADNFVTFRVNLSEPSSNPVTMDFEALSGTATVTSDFDILNSTLTIPAGMTTGRIFVRTVADNGVEPDEEMVLALTNPSNGVFAGGGASLQATGTILDDDTPAPAPGTPLIIVEDQTVAEGGDLIFTLLRLGPTTDPTTGSFAILPGTADAGADYTAASGQFTFAAGQFTTTITVTTVNDGLAESAETLVLALSDIENGVLPGSATEAFAIGTIADGSKPVIEGTSASETIFSTAAAEQIFGFGGDDRILGLEGDDDLFGGLGNDTLNGGDGDDVIAGEAGEDRVYAGLGNDIIDGGDDNDLIFGNAGDDTITGGLGNDNLRGNQGADIIDGAEGDDIVFGGDGNDTMTGGLGNDTLSGNGGNDIIDGGDGNDTVIGQLGVDTLRGGDGNDELRGGGGNDTLFGEAGDDLMFGGTNNDTMDGGDGNDTMNGNTQDDILSGGDGNDILRGGDGADSLFGEAGNDTLEGGNGNDIMDGGSGQDILRGFANRDTFVFSSAADSAFGAADLIDGIDGVGLASGDVIDVSAIDADANTIGNQAFIFLGELTTADGLAAGAGALWVENFGNQTRLYGSVDGDNTIDLAVRINDGAVTTAADYFAGDFIV